jgi:hypothetical protein
MRTEVEYREYREYRKYYIAEIIEILEIYTPELLSVYYFKNIFLPLIYLSETGYDIYSIS